MRLFHTMAHLVRLIALPGPEDHPTQREVGAQVSEVRCFSLLPLKAFFKGRFLDVSFFFSFIFFIYIFLHAPDMSRYL